VLSGRRPGALEEVEKGNGTFASEGRLEITGNQTTISIKKGGVMTIQYLLVTYPDQRAVLADGTGVGFTNHTLMLPADEYVITLDADGFQPASQNVVLAGTSIVKPMVIAFARTAPKAV